MPRPRREFLYWNDGGELVALRYDDWKLVITYDWKAASEKWTAPVGGGFGKLFKIGKQAMNARIEALYDVVRPNSAPERSAGFTIQFLFPKS